MGRGPPALFQVWTVFSRLLQNTHKLLKDMERTTRAYKLSWTLNRLRQRRVKTGSIRFILDRIDSKAVTAAKINRMLAWESVYPVSTQLALLILFTSNKDGPFYFCLDYLKLNPFSMEDFYPVPRMSACVDSSANWTVISGLDTNLGYCKIGIDGHTRDKTVSAPKYAVHRSTTTLIELKNTAGISERNVCYLYICALAVRSSLPR